MFCSVVSVSPSGFLGAQVRAPPCPKASGVAAIVRIECSSRPQKKATAHHMKTRPKKTQPWDIRRKPTVYAPLPPLPPEWVLSEAATAVAVAVASSESPADPPAT